MKTTFFPLLLAGLLAAPHAFGAKPVQPPPPPSEPTSWKLTGNAGTIPGTHFLGTTDYQPLEFRQNNVRVLHVAKSLAAETVNIVAGSIHNIVAPGLSGVTIAGGGAGYLQGSSFPAPNSVESDFSTISGGARNFIFDQSAYSTVGGGNLNAVYANAGFGTVSGGLSNQIGEGSLASTIAGGFNNRVHENAPEATIAGGYTNAVGAGATRAFIAGGAQNYANAPYTFVAGYCAKADHAGSFVWSGGGEQTTYSDEAENEFRVRAPGGVHFAPNTSINFGANVRQMLNLWKKEYGIGVQANTLYQRTANTFAWYKGGVHHDNYINAGGGTTLMLLNTGGLTVNGTFISKSDRNAKENFAAVDPTDLLTKVLTLPISRWNYKDDDAKSAHVGPMAQDFHAAFKLGADDKHIATVDADGVALAAIQGLYAKVQQENAELTTRLVQMERQNAEQMARLTKVEALLSQLPTTR